MTDAEQEPTTAPPRREVRQRSEWEIRWRQARNAPPPVVRAVLANVTVATIGGILLLLSDWLSSRGVIPGYLQELGPLIYVATVVISGSIFTYLWVELPTGVPSLKYGMSSSDMIFETTPLLPCRPAILSPTFSLRLALAT